MSQHKQVTPHLARYARHPLPKGEGWVPDFGPMRPAEDVRKNRTRVEGRKR